MRELEVQTLDRNQLLLKLAPGLPDGRRHHRERHGVTSLFVPPDSAGGRAISSRYQPRQHEELLHFLKGSEECVPDWRFTWR